MNSTKNILSLLVLCFFFSLVSCQNDDDAIEIPNEEEVITTVYMNLISDAGGETTTFSFQDLDGDGGNAPVVVGGTLAQNQTYTIEMDLLNELEDPAESITAEIEEEAEEHQFFFQSDIEGISFSYEDEDADGNPIGLMGSLTTTTSGSGTITVILKHEPNKNAEGVASGDMTNAAGETDVEVVFNVEVQ